MLPTAAPLEVVFPDGRILRVPAGFDVAVLLSGKIYGYERFSGKFRWMTEVNDQFLILDQIRDLPILV